MNFPDTSEILRLLAAFTRFISAPEMMLALQFCTLFVLSCYFLMSHRRIRGLRASLASAEQQGDASQELITSLKESDTRHKIRQARLVTIIRSERKNSAEKLALLEEAREELRLQFSALAQEIFEDKSATFTSQSGQQLETLLKPFHTQLESLKTEMRQTYMDDTRERASLKKEIHHLQELNQRINQEALNLTNALKGDRKIQGNWGEIVLERVLEQSGLRQGHEYEIQRGYRDSENSLYKPDVIIRLPDEKDIIVDSKVSLSAWERYCSNDNVPLQQQALEDLVLAIRNHIVSLGSKQYEDLKGLRSLDFVLMFMPIEAAFSVACNHDDSLITEALSKKIVVVTPTTLLATLRTVENIWRYEHQSRNSLEIARRAGKLYDKFRGFVEDMEKIGRQLSSCQATYDGAFNKLTQGRGNLVAQAQQLTDLGVQVKKELPKSITEPAETETSD